MKNIWQEQLKRSFYVHKPLEIDFSKSVENRLLQKPAHSPIQLWNTRNLSQWKFDGEGKYTKTDDDTLHLETHPTAEKWPESEVRAGTALGEYTTFGSFVARLNVSDLQLNQCNRIRFEIYVDCPGMHSPIVRVGLVNNGTIKLPDAYTREGFHAMNLKNHEWNSMSWEIDSLPHDKIEEISFTLHRYGKELSGGLKMNFQLRNIYMDTVEVPEVAHGWQCLNETATFSTTGYPTLGKKVAIANTTQTTFSIIDACSKLPVLNGAIEKFEKNGEIFSVIDFSALEKEGEYQICFGNYTSEIFAISETIFHSTIWKLLNFLFCQRCGFPVPEKHGTCHQDVIATHNGLTMSYGGGWHDAADVSQQTVQSAEILYGLLETASRVKGNDFLLYERLVEECNWGLDFILRTRFGDGYRATNSIIRRWTDNLIGNMDDSPVNVHNHSFENFICAGVEAFASVQLKDRDAPLAWKCADAAKEDFQFALERFRIVGLEEGVVYEHATCASLSQYYAAACWAAAQLFAATQKEEYSQVCAEFAKKTIQCQEQNVTKAPFIGFFYRDESHKTIVHFSHQARDQIFIQGLTSACTAIPNHKDKPHWEHAMLLYGQYLKSLQKFTMPYGMLPAGLYHENELNDVESFSRVHFQVDFDKEHENFKEQLTSGVCLGNGYVVRNFPVWFSFRGNSAIHLSMGKAASLLGKYFNDDTLCECAKEQLYWTLGKNPFGQSLIYGEGSSFGQQYAALQGETVGEMPVGVQTKGNEDLPYWPAGNIATYREVWSTPPGKWLCIVADLL